jgi:microcystin-dependent protein
MSTTLTYLNTGVSMTSINTEQITVSSLADGFAYISSSVLNTTSVIPVSSIDPSIQANITALQANVTTLQNDLLALLPTGCLFQYAGGTAPSGWFLCQGQVLSISSYPSLYSVIGTTYGGDGVSTFALPDLRGRVPIGAGSGYSLGTTGGSETRTLTVNEMPSHNHTGTIDYSGTHSHTYQDAYFAENTGRNPKVFGLAAGSDYDNNFYYRTTSNGYTSDPNDASTFLSSGSGGAHTHTMSITSNGGGNSFSIMQPYITLSYIIKY